MHVLKEASAFKIVVKELCNVDDYAPRRIFAQCFRPRKQNIFHYTAGKLTSNLNAELSAIVANVYAYQALTVLWTAFGRRSLHQS